ncbi:hypothetical protein CR513_60536, partial [Mucuna pruriens]
MLRKLPPLTTHSSCASTCHRHLLFPYFSEKSNPSPDTPQVIKEEKNTFDRRGDARGCKKLSHIEGNDPPRDDPKFEAWDDEDSLIMAWLWNSMTPEISRNYMFYSSALWIELDQYQGLNMCKVDSVAYTGLVEKERIFKFLHGLNFEYDPIRVQILGSAMVTRKGPTKGSTSKEKPFTKSSRGEYCTYCKRSGHTKDTCNKRYGKEKVLERMSGNKGSTQMWVNQTTSNKENGVEHPSTSQLD